MVSLDIGYLQRNTYIYLTVDILENCSNERFTVAKHIIATRREI